MASSSTELVTEFLDTNGIKWFPIDINAKKQPVTMQCYGGVPTASDFKKLTDVQIKARHKFLDWFDHIAIDTNTVNQIDVDTTEKSEKYH